MAVKMTPIRNTAPSATGTLICCPSTRLNAVNAVKEIARKVKDTRDATFEETDKNGLTVNRTPAIASLGGSQENSEEEYLILKMMRSLGVIAIDNQARV